MIRDYIITILGSSAVIGFFVTLFQKSIIDAISNRIKFKFDKDLKTHEAVLKATYDAQLETLKADFAKNHYRFSTVFEDTAKTIIQTYQMLVELREAVQVNLAVAGNTDERANKQREVLSAKRMEVYYFLIKNKIYLQRATAQKIDAFTRKLMEIHITYEAHLKNRTPESNQKISDAMNSMFNEVPKLLEELEDDFKDILGLQ